MPLESLSCKNLNYLSDMLALITVKVIARSSLNLGLEPNNKNAPKLHTIVRCLLNLAPDNIFILLTLRKIWNDWDGLPHVNMHDTNSTRLEEEHV